MSRLQRAGIKTCLFAGWAEELLGLQSPRDHHDVDLLYPAADFAEVDAFIARDGQLAEIAAKRQFASACVTLGTDILRGGGLAGSKFPRRQQPLQDFRTLIVRNRI